MQIKAAEAEQRGEIYTIAKTNYVTDATTGVRSLRTYWQTNNCKKTRMTESGQKPSFSIISKNVRSQG